GEYAINEINSLLPKIGCNSLLIYPFAHLSSNLAKPAEALEVVKQMESRAKEIGITTFRAPFGWNKKLSLDIKGHPLAEQSRSFDSSMAKQTIKKDLTLITYEAKKQHEILWYSASMVLAAAVKSLYPDVKIGGGLPTNEGFYYDFDGRHFSDDDFEKIEKEMNDIIKKDIFFERKSVSREKSKEMFEGEKYKLELTDDITDDKISILKLGDFHDISRGAFAESTGRIGAVKLLKVGGAFWLGSSKNPMLQRIHGIAFVTKKELANYLEMRKKAEEIDHRKLGTRLDLFSFQEEAPGMVFLHPKGMILKNLLLDFWRMEHKKRGYKEINTPIILNRILWERSGHWDHYKENMYFTDIDEQEFAVKPMNCPGAILVYKTANRSYKDLPLRLAEVGLVHRHELSGVLSGLFRVRCFNQDDAHIFLAPEQLEDEINNVIEIIDYFYKIFGFEYHIELSTKPDDHIGSDDAWENAENALKKALERRKVKYKLNAGDGAFYGPKIDFHLRDCIGRAWQCATVQVDFAMPERFNVEFAGNDGRLHRPVIIHRVIYGAIERFMGILIEHYAGAFPLWLAPVQAVVLPITDRNIEYAESVKKILLEKDFRVSVDTDSKTLQYKIREAQLQKIPYMIIIGDKEQSAGTIAVRNREGKTQYGLKIEDFAEQIKKEAEEKR
ncbi:MAG: threonine--tRNA ligase, partial [Candidatus Aenigmarchaeota archaeon]|nr:threonine--tRNA ligase [Candidatus Aenigmarchaeota archaeon]MDI6722774.1 threonine--tRNA ligase [Candidatus Aenigmarchaeota archaeon]